MPTLHWASKKPPAPVPASLEIDAFVFPQGAGYSSPQDSTHLSFSPTNLPSNRLIFGDNLSVMSALLPEYEGRLHLIYADPPFFTNRRYPARVGRGEDSRRPKEWQLAEGYPDHWSDMDAYLDMLYPRLALMHRLLAPTGTLYLHLDWHANAYARLLLDEIFGPEQLLNEIVWVYHGPSPIRSAFNRKHDTILAYTKSKEYTFNVDAVREPYNPNTVKTFASSPKAGFGKVPDLERGKVPEDWWYFPVIARLHTERTGYPTQKPEALLERIILASSNPGELVADFFCGSGTTPVVAARLGRKFIGNDAAWRAIHTTRSRLVALSGDPFTIQVGQPAIRPIFQSPGLPTFQLSETHISLAPEPNLDLDYWEVDPAWDGRVFHSAIQAWRPRQNHPIKAQLRLPFPLSDRPVCVRLVNVSCQQAQIVIRTSS